jgi:acid phosphatase family membrane protein YuiD
MEANKYALLIAPVVGYLAAQFIKFVFTLRKDGVRLSDAIQSGGMPSSHSALMSSLTAAIGFIQGFDSVAFAISAAITAVVMYDAVGVRRTTGEQTAAIKALYKKTETKLPYIHDAKGHSPLEVVAGMVTGIITGYLTVVIL